MLDDHKQTAKPTGGFALNIWLPAGGVLLALGILTLATPFFTTLKPEALVIDMITGGILTAAGIIGLIKGSR